MVRGNVRDSSCLEGTDLQRVALGLRAATKNLGWSHSSVITILSLSTIHVSSKRKNFGIYTYMDCCCLILCKAPILSSHCICRSLFVIGCSKLSKANAES